MAEGGDRDKESLASERNALDVSLSNLMSQLGLIQKELEQVTVSQTTALKAKAKRLDRPLPSSRNLIVLTSLAALGSFHTVFISGRQSSNRSGRSQEPCETFQPGGRRKFQMCRETDRKSPSLPTVTSFADAVAARDTAIGELRRTRDELVQAAKWLLLAGISWTGT